MLADIQDTTTAGGVVEFYRYWDVWGRDIEMSAFALC